MEEENKGKGTENKDALVQVLMDTQKAYQKQNKIKDKVIVLLIVLMFLEAVVGYCGVLWYESQFETVTTEQIELYTEGDNANAEYNDVEGNQYNDSSVHNE